MKRYLIIALALLCGCSSVAPSKKAVMVDTTLPPIEASKRNYSALSTTTCKQSKLSHQFDLAIELKRYSDTTVRYDSCRVKVLVTNKETKASLDSIVFSTLSYFRNTFSNCYATSFSTHFNPHPHINNYYGDIVVADLNFDNRDDIALIKEIIGLNGPVYTYYIQGKDHKFMLDSFLTDSVSYFPEINPSQKTLTTAIPLGPKGGAVEYIYKFNPMTNTWKQTKGKVYNIKFD